MDFGNHLRNSSIKAGHEIMYDRKGTAHQIVAHPTQLRLTRTLSNDHK
jgi:hypothetical protein